MEQCIFLQNNSGISNKELDIKFQLLPWVTPGITHL